MKYLFAICLLSIITISNIQSQELLREPKTLKLFIDASNSYTTNIEESYYLQDENTVQIYPGEVVYLELEVQKKKIISMKAVKENINPEKTIIFDFSQKTKGEIHQAMILRITNPFTYKLYYTAEKLSINELWDNTTVSIVEPGILSYETWGEVIVSLLLSDFKLK